RVPGKIQRQWRERLFHRRDVRSKGRDLDAQRTSGAHCVVPSPDALVVRARGGRKLTKPRDLLLHTLAESLEAERQIVPGRAAKRRQRGRLQLRGPDLGNRRGDVGGGQSRED